MTFMAQICSSKGKNSTSMAQEDLNIAELSQVTSPRDVTITFVLRIPAAKE
jgi:hypothetical protein